MALGPENTYGSYGLNWANLSNTPFKKFKTYTHEGGISTPLIVHWPKGIVDKNVWRKQPAHIIDIMATALDVADMDYPSSFNGQLTTPIDGKSLLGVLQKDESLNREALFWEHQGNKAVRAGDWKLVFSFEEQNWELYDLNLDRTETNDLAANFPNKVMEMQELYHQWAKRSNVLEWEELSINIIPPENNPLIRSDEEMKKIMSN
jgi:arylsulfatase